MNINRLFRLNTLLLLIFNLSLGIILMGCAETRAAQCQKIFKIAEKATAKTEELTQNGQEIDKSAWLLAADEIEDSAIEMENLTVNDENLQQYQAGFVQVYRDYAAATREIVKVLDSRDIIAAKAAQEKVRRAGKMERELGQEINAYCQAN